MNVTSLDMSVSTLTPRLLLGPGPSPVSPRVLEALARPTLGHLDPQFLALLDDVNERLRGIFATQSRTTFPVSGTGSAGMEAALVNLLEPGDTAIVGVIGYFGGRMAEMARRVGAEVVTVEAEWGNVLDPQQMIDAHRKHPDARVMALVHAETSTGALQPIDEIADYLAGHETLFVVDAVTSLGGVELDVDRVGIDVCYSGTQKCLGGPPGLAPITFSEAAERRIRTRTVPVGNWYLDVSLITGYVAGGEDRRYHHTAPINLFYALHESLREFEEEGKEVRFERHRRVGARLQAELAERGFSPFTDPDHRLSQLTAVTLPGGRDERPLRAQLLERHGIEVGGGLGPAKGRIWRVGLMGHGARDESVDRLLTGIDDVLGR